MAHADAKLLDADSHTVIDLAARGRPWPPAGRDAHSCPAPDRPEKCASRRIVSVLCSMGADGTAPAFPNRGTGFEYS
jgi:hypothetical protein